MKASLAVAAVLLASLACLAGCGGSGSDGSTAPVESSSPSVPTGGDEKAGSAGETAAEGIAGAGAEEKSGEEEPGAAAGQSHAERKRREARERAAYERKRYGDPSASSAPFAKYSGKANDEGVALHLAEFGQEAGEADAAEVQAAIEDYLSATAGAEWERACGHLALEVKLEVEGVDDCPSALPKLISTFGKGAAQTSSIRASQGIASLRVQKGGRAGEGAGFALFHGSDGEDHWMAVKRQGGRWRVLSISPQGFG